MIMFILQSLLLIGIAFVVGAVCGCALRSILGRRTTKPEEPAKTEVAVSPQAAHRITQEDERVSLPDPVPETAHDATHINPSQRRPGGDPAAPDSSETPDVAAAPARRASRAKAAGKPGSKSRSTGTAARKSARKPSPAATAAEESATAGDGEVAADKGSGRGRRAGAASAETVADTAVPAPQRARRKRAAAKPAAAEARPRRTRTAPAAAAPVAGDDLTRITGVGPVIEAKLKASGVTTFSQIANWTEADRAAFSRQLNFSGRIEREDWVGQARRLAAGDGGD